MKKIGVIIGPSKPSEQELKRAYEVGKLLAEEGYIVATGGRGGIMEAAFKGAKSSGGATLAIIPSENKEEANKYSDIIIPTGIGHLRNVILVLSGDIIISVGLSPGTFTEISYALLFKKKIFTYGFKIREPYEIECIKTLEELKKLL
jgi:hypothetical protein